MQVGDEAVGPPTLNGERPAGTSTASTEWRRLGVAPAGDKRRRSAITQGVSANVLKTVRDPPRRGGGRGPGNELVYPGPAGIAAPLQQQQAAAHQ